MTSEPTVAEALKKAYDGLSPSERRISRFLMADYPVAGLEPVQRLAERANVSAPTVLRMLLRLGLGSYPEFQRRLREEISLRGSSPLAQYDQRQDSASQDPSIDRARRVFREGIDATFEALSAHDLDSLTDLLSDARRPVLVVGGRYSDLLAQYLALHLRMLRPRVTHVTASESERTLALMDLRPKDVVIAFDYRRYQASTVEFVEHAKAAKASTVLFTDPWLSPAAKYADLLASSSVEAPSPFDSLAPAFALVETVIAAVVDRLDAGPVQRIRQFDDLNDRMFPARSNDKNPS